MRIPRGTARLLLEEARREPFHGSVLQLGLEVMLEFLSPERLYERALRGQ